MMTKSVLETEKLGEHIGALLHPGDIVALRGDMGMGKTAFVRGLARGMGLSDHVHSPTFAIVNEYRNGKTKLYHFDMYRISGEDELDSIGFWDYLDDKNAAIVIEWSENIDHILPKNRLEITFTPVKGHDEYRKLEIKGDNRFENTQF